MGFPAAGASILEAQVHEARACSCIGRRGVVAVQTWIATQLSERGFFSLMIRKAEVRGRAGRGPVPQASGEDSPGHPGEHTPPCRSRSSQVSSPSGCFGDYGVGKP